MSSPRQVFEQVAAEEVRRFSGDKTVAEAGLYHGSVLLFRSAQPESTSAWPARPAAPQSQAQAKPTTVPATAMSSVVPINTAAAAAVAAMSAHQTVTRVPKPLLPARKGIDAAVAAASAVVVGNTAPAPAKVAAPSSSAAPAVVGTPPLSAASISAAAVSAAAAAAAATPVDPSSSSPSASPSSSSSSSSTVLPTSPLLQLPVQQQQATPVANNGVLAAAKAENTGGASANGKNAPGWDGNHIAATAAAAAAGAGGAAGNNNIPVVMNAEAQKRATFLALYQVSQWLSWGFVTSSGIGCSLPSAWESDEGPGVLDFVESARVLSPCSVVSCVTLPLPGRVGMINGDGCDA